MAILKGFPPSNTISSSVRITEKDLSFYTTEQSFHRAGLVGFASKGPVNIPTMVSSIRQLHTVFGFPHPDVGDPYLIYAAEQYLSVGSELFVVRVADEDHVSDESASVAEVDILAAGAVVDIFSDTAGPYSFSTDSFFRFRLNGLLSSKTLVVLADDNRPAPDAGDPWDCTDLVAELNSQLDTTIDGIQFYVHTGDKIGVKTVWAFGPDAELELVSVQDAVYGPSSVLGLGTTMETAKITGTADRYPNNGYTAAGTFNFSGLTDLNIQVVVDGTENVLIDNVIQTIDLADLEGGSWSAAQVVAEINQQIDDLPGGFEAVAVGNNVRLQTLHSGRDARMVVKSDSTADTILGLANTTALGKFSTNNEIATTGDSGIEAFGRVKGGENDDSTVSITVKAETAGIEGNTTVVKVTNDVRAGVFNLEVYNNGVQVESWGNLTKDQSSRFYVETFISLVSDYIRVTDNTATTAPPVNSPDAGVALTGGSDGIPSDPDKQDDLLIGNPINFSGMYALSEPEQIDVDLIACPGHASTAVVQALLDVAQNYRSDCLAIVDAPFGLTVNEIVAWQNGGHPLNTVRFDSDFGALYWPWVKIRDSHNRVDVWVPPSGAVMATIARSDALSAPWYAPAGLLRGIVPNVTDVFSRPTLAERDLMYGNRNAINPIIQFVDVEGFVIWGQKTLQRLPTALDRVNVRRMMFYVEKQIKNMARTMLFDPHDGIFRSRFTNRAREILSSVKAARGINDFFIKADEELNTPDVIDRNEFRARIGIQPIKAVEFIFIEFSIHRTGDFTETADTF